MWYVCDVLYAVLYVRVSCFVVRICAVSRRYINICNCDMFSVVNVYRDHLKFCVVCIDGRRNLCCSECNVVSNECNNGSTSCLVQPIGTHGGEVVYFGCVCFRGELFSAPRDFSFRLTSPFRIWNTHACLCLFRVGTQLVSNIVFANVI